MIPTSKQAQRKITNNARERQRVLEINQALQTLRQKLPDGETTFSKIETLEGTIRYIKQLEEILKTTPESSLGPSVPFTPIQLHHATGISMQGTDVPSTRRLGEGTGTLDVSFTDSESKEERPSSSRKPDLDKDQPDSLLLLTNPDVALQASQPSATIDFPAPAPEPSHVTMPGEQQSLADFDKQVTLSQIQVLSQAVDHIGAELAAMNQLSNKAKREVIDSFILQLEQVKAHIPADPAD